MAGKPNAAELEMLTEEEREGMLDEDTVDEGLEDGDDAVGDDTGAAVDDKAGEGAGQDGKGKSEASDGDEVDDAGTDDAAAADAAAKAKQEADAKAAADAAAVEAAAGATDNNAEASAAVEPKPIEGDKRPSWALDPKVPEQIDALEKQKDELTDKFDDGEFTGKEYRAELRKIDAQLEGLKTQRLAAEIGKTNAVQHYFDVTVPEFLAKHTEYQKGSILHAMLEAEVKKLQVASQNALNPAILERAHQNLTEQVTKAYGVKPGAQTKPKGDKAAAAREVVPTLGTVPAADPNEANDGGEFAWLDRLANADVEKYEQELAKLSDEKRDRYLAE